MIGTQDPRYSQVPGRAWGREADQVQVGSEQRKGKTCSVLHCLGTLMRWPLVPSPQQAARWALWWLSHLSPLTPAPLGPGLALPSLPSPSFARHSPVQSSQSQSAKRVLVLASRFCSLAARSMYLAPSPFLRPAAIHSTFPYRAGGRSRRDKPRRNPDSASSLST